MIQPISRRITFALNLAGVALAFAQAASAVVVTAYVLPQDGEGRFPLCASRQVAPLVVSTDDHAGVIRAAKELQADLARVTGIEPRLVDHDNELPGSVVLVGTIGKSPLIDRLVRERKLNVAGVAGRWEAFLIEAVDDPLPGVDCALVIAGSDKRGTIFGIYDLAAQIGVSPWNWWADVPVRRQANLYVLPGRRVEQPAVKYRGIFINDEAPALAGWAQENFGGFNHEFYEHVFELILRLKGNYLWPAMWGRAIYDDDPLSPKLADEYGVVIGTSHHEPMMRAHVEWERHGSGPWNYEQNADKLREFWTEGVRRMGTNESIVTLGMRGDGDMPMTEGANIALLERIVADQRKILAEESGRPLTEIPQKWALYKEVQEYYDKGMRVPDDVTLLLCDDNWGNIRKLPKLSEKPRSGGYGIYYHFDYVGGPRNYKWLNTNQIERVWEQMHLAYHYGADRIWIVNVGDIKPIEFPIEFFLDYAWNPDAWPAERLREYTRRWAADQFGEEHAAAIADILTKYTKYNSRRKPELLAPDTYSLVNYREAERVVAEYNELVEKAAEIGQALPSEFQDAYYQLVLFPVEACANLNELYVTTGRNRLYAKQGRAATNESAKLVKALFAKDAELTRYYNRSLAGGKWSHMMDQTHIGYTYWQQPDRNTMPEVDEIELPAGAQMGVAVEGSERCWPGDTVQAMLPELHQLGCQEAYLEVFNRGQAPFDFRVDSDKTWVRVSPSGGRVENEQRVTVSIDWEGAPVGRQQAMLTVNGPDGSQVSVELDANKPPVDRDLQDGFVESDGYVSIEAPHYTRAVDVPPIRWQRVDDLGRTSGAVMPTPVTSPTQTPGGTAPRLEYRVQLETSGTIKVRAFASPTLDFTNTEGLHYAVSFDDQEPQTVNLNSDGSLQAWERWVADNINVTTTEHHVAEPGLHVLKFWMVDPGVVLQKLVIDTGGLRTSYLGPPESIFSAGAEGDPR